MDEKNMIHQSSESTDLPTLTAVLFKCDFLKKVFSELKASGLPPHQPHDYSVLLNFRKALFPLTAKYNPFCKRKQKLLRNTFLNHFGKDTSTFPHPKILMHHKIPLAPTVIECFINYILREILGKFVIPISTKS